MKKLLLLLLFAPHLLCACGDNPVDDAGDEGPDKTDPAITLPAGTKEDPARIEDLPEFIGRNGVWVEGYIAGAGEDDLTASSTTAAGTNSYLLLSDKAQETDAAKCVRIELEADSDIRGRLDIAVYPDLLGEKIKVRGDVVRNADGKPGMLNLTDLEGGREPLEKPDPDDPDPVEPDDPNPPVTGTVELDRLYGYAAGTTGGEGASPAHIHHFDDGSKFGQWLALREKNKDKTPAIVYLSGTFTKDQGRGSGSPWFDIKRTGNISIYGTNDFVMQNVGFFLKEASNIIIRNVYIVMPKADNGADGISMQESNNIWVDHCTFESVNQTKDYEDGSCDVTHHTYNVTVSWCHFIKTQKSCLVGHSNSETEDAKITATFHHNFFDRSSSRHPRVRFGRAHVYNNYFNQVTTYGVGSAYGAMVLVEDNLFDGVRLPTDICTFPAKQSGNNWVSNLQGSVAGYLYERGNDFRNKPSNATEPYPLTNIAFLAYNGEQRAEPYAYEDFKPAYDYIVDPAADLATIIPSASGVGKLPGYATAPVAVDNGGIATPTDPTDPTDPDTPDTPDPEVPDVSDLGNGWTLLNSGSASAVASGGQLTLTACGKFASGEQTFGYVFREISGNFTATVQVDSFTPQKDSNQALAGLLVTPDPTAVGTDFLHAMAAKSQSAYYHSSRLAAGATANKGTLAAPAAGAAAAVLKIERQGDKCKLSYSLDGGATFGNASSKSIAGLADKVFIGLALSSGDSKKTGTAAFSDFRLNGEAVAFSAE